MRSAQDSFPNVCRCVELPPSYRVSKVRQHLCITVAYVRGVRSCMCGTARGYYAIIILRFIVSAAQCRRAASAFLLTRHSTVHSDVLCERAVLLRRKLLLQLFDLFIHLFSHVTNFPSACLVRLCAHITMHGLALEGRSDPSGSTTAISWS